MNSDYSFQNFSSFDPASGVNKPNLTYDTKSHLLILDQDGIEKRYQVRLMGKDVKNFALTAKQQGLLGDKIAELISKKLNLKTGTSLETLTITNKGIKIHTLNSRAVVITFIPSELQMLSDIFPKKIPSVPSGALPIDPNRVVAGPEKQRWAVSVFLKNTFEKIFTTFSGLVSFFLPQKEEVDPDNLDIDFIEVTNDVNYVNTDDWIEKDDEEPLIFKSAQKDKNLDELIKEQEE
jgi:hypothetical protein